MKLKIVNNSITENIIKHYISLMILGLFLSAPLFISSCANPLPPSGGPKDTTSPKIKSFYPLNKTLNFNGTNNIKIEFDKYMNKNSVIENLNIQPKIQTEYDWSGKNLDIIFTEKLRPNTTYSVNLQANYMDYHSITPDEEFCLVFSTGSDLDSGIIKGKLSYGQNTSKAPNTYIFVYSIDKMNPDTLNPGHTKPDYKVSVGNTGNFTINALKDGKYRIFAANDDNKDDLINAANEAYATANKDFIVKNSKSDFANLYLGTVRDITKPQLISVEQLTSDIIEVQFSEPINIKSIKNNSFEISDSAGTEKYNIKAFYPDLIKKDIIHLLPDTLLKDRHKYKLNCKTDSSNAIRDTSNNIMDAFSAQMPFIANNAPAKYDFNLMNVNLKDSSLTFHPDSSIYIGFNMLPKIKIEDTDIKIFDFNSNTEVETVKNVIAPNLVEVKPKVRLQSDSWYYIYSQFNKYEDFRSEKMKDTTLKIRFKTIDLRANISVDGHLVNNSGIDSHFIIRLISKKDNSQYFSICDDSLKWSFKELEPGDYKFEVFADRNNSGHYDYGSVSPFTFSEPIFFPEKIITLKPRWSLNDVKIEIK